MAKNKRENKTGTLIFRLPTSDDKKFDSEYANKKIVGIDSKNLYARKIIIDYISGKLAYLDPEAARDNPLLARRDRHDSFTTALGNAS